MGPEVATISALRARDVRAEQPFLSRAWGLYVFAAVLLVPVVVPSGPGQLAIMDPINVVALACFLVAVLARGAPFRLPFALPLLLVSAGSLLAMTNSVSVTASFMALAKDAYLYLWFAALVELFHSRGDLRGLRLAWMGTAILISLSVFVQSIAGAGASVWDVLIAGRLRANGTFYNPNMFADYLMFSIFILLGLEGQVRWRILGLSLVILLMGVLSTKSNGGLISLGAGLLAWAPARALVGGVPRVRVGAVLILGLAIALGAAWMHVEWGVGDALVRGLTQQSFVGRVAKSSQSREQIWHRLEETYTRSPLGIGPKNSAEQTLGVGARERPNSFLSKEAHDDYLAYAVERGPLGIAGLLLCLWQIFAMVIGSRRQLNERTGSVRAGGALWAALLGALVGTSVHSLVIEKLHFRHFWLFLAIVTALCSRASTPGPVALAPEPRRIPDPAGDARVAPRLAVEWP